MNKNRNRKEDIAAKEAIKILLKAIIGSVLLSSAGLMVAPIPAYGLLLFGIAALPVWIAVPILYGTIVTISVVPDIYTNVYVTRKLPLAYRAARVVSYIAIFSPIARALFLWGFGSPSW
jgi:hypothetical protein